MSGISAQYVNGLEFRIKELGEQIEKLTKERDTLKTVPMKYRRMKFNAELQDEVRQQEQQLAALAKQNAKFRETLSRWRYQNLSYNWCCGNCGAVDGDEHKEGCALSLPDLATPVLNRIKAECMREAAMHCSKHGSRTADEVSEDLFANADELEQSNG